MGELSRPYRPAVNTVYLGIIRRAVEEPPTNLPRLNTIIDRDKHFRMDFPLSTFHLQLSTFTFHLKLSTFYFLLSPFNSP